MKKLFTILTACSLALAATATAENDDAPGQKKKQAQGGHGGKPAQAHGPAVHARGPAPQAHGPAVQPRASKPAHNAVNRQPVQTQPAQAKVAGPKKHNPKTASAPASNPVPNLSAKNAEKVNKARARQLERQQNAAKAPAPAPAPAANTPVATNAAQPQPQVNQRNRQAKKLDRQQVQQIRNAHQNFRAQPRPEKVRAVTFNPNYRINGSNRWQGERYARFRSYHPQMHDRGWYSSRYNRIQIIAGGAYYWNGGYWYPAWGYDPGAQYYPYDGPIYVGARARPLDRVIADVQAVLQEQGYYRGEVDGLLGPLTREALTEYQADHGLYTTAAIDEPTLDSLGMG